MANASKGVNSEPSKDTDEQMELTDVDRLILDELREGRATQGYLVDETGEPRHRIHKQLQLLAAAGHIKKVHEQTALYELVEDPRDEEAEDDG